MILSLIDTFPLISQFSIIIEFSIFDDMIVEFSYNKEKPKEMSGDKSVKILQSGINELDKIKNRAINKINQQSIPQEVRDIIKEKELSPDLLKQVEGKTQPKSLLGKEE